MNIFSAIGQVLESTTNVVTGTCKQLEKSLQVTDSILNTVILHTEDLEQTTKQELEAKRIARNKELESI